MSEQEDQIQEGAEVTSAWPLLIGGTILGLILGVISMYGYQQLNTEAPTETQEINTSAIEKLVTQIDQGNTQNVKSFLIEAKSQIASLSETNHRLQSEARTELVYNPTVQHDKIREKIINEIKIANDVVWITNATRNTTIVQACRNLVRVGKKISVLTKKSVIPINIKLGKSSGFYTYRCNAEFSDDISLLIIDSNKIIDISNPDILWISREPTTVKSVINWYEQLIETGIQAL